MTAELLQRESEISECPDKDFQLMGRCKMILLLPKTGYNKYSELYLPSYVHFNSGAAFGVGFHWRRALPPHFSRHLLHIHQFQHRSIWLRLFGDVPSHPRPCRHLLLHQQPTSWLWVNRIKSLSSKSICWAAHCQNHSWSQALQGISILGSSFLMVMGHPQTHSSSKSNC